MIVTVIQSGAQRLSRDMTPSVNVFLCCQDLGQFSASCSTCIYCWPSNTSFTPSLLSQPFKKGSFFLTGRPYCTYVLCLWAFAAVVTGIVLKTISQAAFLHQDDWPRMPLKYFRNSQRDAHICAVLEISTTFKSSEDFLSGKEKKNHPSWKLPVKHKNRSPLWCSRWVRNNPDPLTSSDVLRYLSVFWYLVAHLWSTGARMRFKITKCVKHC